MMRRCCFVPTFILLLLLIAPSVRADLAGDIRAVLHDKYFEKIDVGIAVARLGEGSTTDVLFRSESDIPLIPASNLKLLTTSAFLDHFGADFRFRTLLLQKDND